MTNRDEAVGPGRANFALAAGAGTLFLLALGHTLSNLVRTMPAVSTDVIADSLSVSAGDVAALTGIYHLAFAAGQIPVGVALDRYSVRTVFLVLIATIVVGALVTAGAPNPVMFLAGQAVLGLGCSGLLLCPLTYAARHQNSANFALWSAFILAVGNSGMLLSASPMAWVIDTWSWRTGFLVPAALAVAVASIAWFRLGRDSAGTPRPSSIRSEFAQVVHIGWLPKLRGVIALAFVSFAVVIGIRGVWSGPWLMDVRGLSRIEAGNVMLALTIMLIVVPMLVGLIDRRTKRTNLLLVGGHILAGLALLLLPLGSAAGLPTLYDLGLLVSFGIAISVQPLLFALGRQSVDPAHTGKALAAVNLAFFAGAAAIQMLSAPVAWLTGIGGVVSFLGLLSISGAVVFALRSRST
ncbi:MAG: MFS transporter [Kaiparowitsia implicata GSE-PSE-MK54-09C]|jgi:predicted MFS family arabinose efflux permease|nr:MFS transporter [Kaiparowitsia implicata GSE-PSE-MK54-09C]